MIERCTTVKDYLLPKAIYAAEKVDCAERLLTNAETQIHINKNQSCTLKAGGYIVLDFGRELHGGIRILTDKGVDECSEYVRIRFGESVAECYAELGENNAINAHSPRDMRVCLLRLSDSEFGQTGFRFVRIDNYSDRDCEIAAIFAAYVHLGQEYNGSFKCNDELVNKIFDTAAYTLYLNMQNRLWDGIKRDRLVWIGDMHPEAKGILNLFGEHRLIESGLKESAEHNPVPLWITSIPSYSVWWIAILCDYEWYTGKWDFVETQLDYLYDLLGQFDKCVDKNGVLDYNASGVSTKTSLFLNWETVGEEGLECGNRGLMLWTLRKASAMLKRRNKDSKLADDIVGRLEKNTEFNTKSKAVASMYALGYKLPEEGEKILVEGGAEGFSTFISSYICNALTDLGKGQEALGFMKDFYNGMLSRGATSFWESFEPSWLEGSGRIDRLPEKGEKDIHSSFGKHCYGGFRLSLCHGWACGPVPFLMERALGVKFMDVGGKKIKIEPNLMGLEWVEGAIPTAYGLIKISHKRTASGVETKYDLPAGVEIVK